MRRFWLGSSLGHHEKIEIQGELFHHLKDVCRFGVGDQFELLEAHVAWRVQVENVAKRSLTVIRLDSRQLPSPPLPYIHIALSIPRWTKVDWIVEKCVELGVHSLQLFVSDYSFLRNLKEISEAKLDRCRKLVIQSAQQSGRGELMEILPPQTWDQLLAQVKTKGKKDLYLFPYEGECTWTLKQALTRLPAKKDIQSIWVLVGSEGGFSTREVEQMRILGLEPLSLGQQVLRVETACLALASILEYEFELI